MTIVELKKLSFQHPIIAYDGHCLLCDGFIKKTLAIDRKEKIRYAVLQKEAGSEINNLLDKETDSVLLLENGVIFTHSDVALKVFRKIGGLWSILSWAKLFPKALRDAVYRFVARNRYKWFGKSDTCIVPPANKKHLFL